MALYPLTDIPNMSPGIRGGTDPQIAGADDWFASQGPPQMTGGPAMTAPNVYGSAPPGGPAPAGQPPTDREGIKQWVTQNLAQYGIQPGARGDRRGLGRHARVPVPPGRRLESAREKCGGARDPPHRGDAQRDPALCAGLRVERIPE